MKPPLSIRLAMNCVAGVLLVTALAYDWLGNVAHEIIGTAMFALLALHNTINRFWYPRTLRIGGRSLHGWTNIVGVALLVFTSLLLLATSLLISRSLFSFLGLNGGFNARQIHGAVAWWMLIIVSLHVGLRWSMIMNAVRGWMGLAGPSLPRTFALRTLAAAVMACGAYGFIVIGFKSKLLAEITMSYWDFDSAALGFFLHVISVAGLCIGLSHYTSTLMTAFRNPISKV